MTSRKSGRVNAIRLPRHRPRVDIPLATPQSARRHRSPRGARLIDANHTVTRISEQTFYRWKKVYGSVRASEARELKQLREENAKLKRLVADLTLDKVMLQGAVQKEVVKPFEQREALRYPGGRSSSRRSTG